MCIKNQFKPSTTQVQVSTFLGFTSNLMPFHTNIPPFGLAIIHLSNAFTGSRYDFKLMLIIILPISAGFKFNSKDIRGHI